jgi:hypothetical protein
MPKNTALHHLRSLEELDEITDMQRLEARTNLKKSKVGKASSKSPLKKKALPKRNRKDDFDWDN